MSLIPSSFNLAILSRFACPSKSFKSPAIIIFPSFCISISETSPNVSSGKAKSTSLVPSAFNLTRRSAVDTPLYVWKFPPTIIFPSDCTAIAWVALLNDAGVKPASNVPSAFNLAIRSRFSILSTFKKFPPIKILSSF